MKYSIYIINLAILYYEISKLYSLQLSTMKKWHIGMDLPKNHKESNKTHKTKQNIITALPETDKKPKTFTNIAKNGMNISTTSQENIK